MSNSLVIDTVEIIAGALVIGTTGMGTRGADVPSSGETYASPIYDDLALPAENEDEFRYDITATDLPAGSYFPFDDTSLQINPDGTVSDGTYFITYRLFKNLVDQGTATITVFIGDGTRLVLTLDDLIFGGNAVVFDPSSLSAGSGYTLNAKRRRLEITVNEISNPGFDDKDPAERILIAFNFSKNLSAIAPSPAPVVTVTRFNGEEDPDPSAIIEGDPIISGAKVLQWVAKDVGVPGCRYAWRCEATGVDGQLQVLTGTMLMRTA